MKKFIQQHDAKILGTLSGFDRLRFRGTLRILAHVGGMMHFLSQISVLLKDFGKYAESVTNRIRETVVDAAVKSGQPVRYLQCPSQSKEALVHSIIEKRGRSNGLVSVLSCVEPCQSFDVYRNRERKIIELVPRRRKCLHYYHYYIDSMFGLMHVRTQTWFPFNVNICLNGREWLAKQMDAAKIGYRRRDNCFVQIDDPTTAQRLMDRQLRTRWPKHLNRLVRASNPVFEEIFREFPVQYYWSVDESEWATDLMFRSAKQLEELFERLVLQGITTFGSGNVMRFLGQKTPALGAPHGGFAGEVISDLRRRPEGVRIKHSVDHNSIKMYDKYGSVLRVETTINHARDMKVYRPKEGDPDGPRQWRYLRKGIADLHRRASLSQSCNKRYLQALAEVDNRTPLGQLLKGLCEPTKWRNKRVRALNPFEKHDGALLEAIARGEFTVNGFRNRDLRHLLYGSVQVTDQTRRRQSGAITRQIRLLRAHHLIRKLPKTHRYQLTDLGRTLVTAISAAKHADTSRLTEAA